MFHSTKLIAEASLEASLASTKAPDASAPAAPKARAWRRVLWFALGGSALIAIVGAGVPIVHPVCGCGLAPINPKSMLNPQQSRIVTLSGRAAQAVPANSVLASKGNDGRHMVIRPDGMLTGAVAPLLYQPAHAGSSVPH